MALAAVACGGKSGTLAVTVVVPVGDDPFTDARTMHIKVGDVADTTVAVAGGHFDASVKFDTPSNGSALSGVVLVEALDAAGAVVAHGHSPVIAFFAADSAVSVWVGRVGRTGVAPGAFPRGRARLAAVAVPRLGVLYAGGAATGDVPVTDAEVYDVYSHQLVVATPLPVARAGAVGFGFDRASQLTGAALVLGGIGQAPVTEATVFDPLGAPGGAWAALATDGSLARGGAVVTELADHSVLITGGIGGDGKPLATAVTLVAPSEFALAPVAATMAAARVGHTATAVKLPQGDAVLIFGGAATGPAAETYLASARSFSVAALGVPSRTGHTATALADGRVLYAGGSDGGAAAAASGFVVAPPGLTVEARPALLATPRSGHTANRVGGDVVVCGGSDANGAALATCEVLDGASLTHKRTVPLAIPRTGHVATLLDTGDLLLAGGLDAAGRPITTLELYTP